MLFTDLRSEHTSETNTQMRYFTWSDHKPMEDRQMARVCVVEICRTSRSRTADRDSRIDSSSVRAVSATASALQAAMKCGYFCSGVGGGSFAPAYGPHL